MHTPDKKTTDSLLQIKQAIVALELGETDTPMLRFFSTIARYISVHKVDIVHVTPEYDLYQSLFEKGEASLQSREVIKEELLQLMKNRVGISLLDQAGIKKVNYEVREGDPLEEILESTRNNQGDLLVLGQKAHTQTHVVLAKNLARQTEGNILVIPQQVSNDLETILVPVDLSSTSLKALETTLSIAKVMQKENSNVNVVCLYVYRVPDINHFKINKPWLQLQSFVKDNIEESFDTFLEGHSNESSDFLKRETIYADDQDIATAIHQYAVEQGVDMIVMGAKGHSKLRHFFLGSVAEKVIDKNEKLPILVVR